MKKLIIMLMCGMMVGSMAFAAPMEDDRSYLPEGEEVNGDLSYEEGGQYYVPTPEEEAMNELIASMPELHSDSYYKVVSVTPFLQENSYYCGPATVKQTINAINGSSESQSAYASKLGTTTSGTDMTRIAPVLNAAQSKKQYVYRNFSDMNFWLSYGKWALNAGVPAVLDINTTNVPAFPYRTTGHFINLSGLNMDSNDGSGTTNQALVTDPFGPGFGNKWYYVTNVYQANRNHTRSAIIS